MNLIRGEWTLSDGKGNVNHQELISFQSVEPPSCWLVGYLLSHHLWLSYVSPTLSKMPLTSAQLM